MEYKQGLIIPIYEAVLLPGSKLKVKINGDIIDEIKNGEVISLTAKSDRKKTIKELKSEEFYSVGTRVSVENIEEKDGEVIADIIGLYPVTIKELTISNNIILSHYEELILTVDINKSEELVLLNEIKKEVRDTGKKFKGSEPLIEYIQSINNLDNMVDALIPFMNISVDDKQRYLTEVSLKNRYFIFREILVKFRDQIDLQIEITQKMTDKTNKQYRKNLLKEQLKTIQEELEEVDGNTNKIDEYRINIRKSHMPEDIEKVAYKELEKLERTGLSGSEAYGIQNYLELLLDLPWNMEELEEINLDTAQEVLDKNHFGLDKVKRLIIQHLAVLKLKKERQGSILLLVGPPGTGKTSLGRSIANAIKREYVRVSLGGVRDEAEIRGHRRTYLGALPGRIINGIKKAKVKNPVFILDELDKVSNSHNGDPYSALLEVLDPEQNNSFSDHYLEVPYDLSDVFFIATANSTNSIPGPLLDRMEVIDISSYTNVEKFHIANDHLIPKVFKDHGISEKQLHITDEVINDIINKYTREAGVRGLNKKLTEIVRYSSEKIINNREVYEVHSDNLSDILGREKVRVENIKDKNISGVVTGLAWTPVGGDILFIETTSMKGSGKFILTGQLGDVMKESATISSSLIRSKLYHLMDNFDFDKNDIHIHVPSGSTPKDGPSAGITLFTAMVSLLTGLRVPSDIAMTGELTLRGEVLPIGGVKEKVIAAHRAGIKHILLPVENRFDIEDVPDEVKEELKFTFVNNIEDVLNVTLNIDIKTVSKDVYISSKSIKESLLV